MKKFSSFSKNALSKSDMKDVNGGDNNWRSYEFSGGWTTTYGGNGAPGQEDLGDRKWIALCAQLHNGIWDTVNKKCIY
jgi:natural product precursor